MCVCLCAFKWIPTYLIPWYHKMPSMRRKNLLPRRGHKMLWVCKRHPHCCYGFGVMMMLWGAHDMMTGDDIFGKNIQLPAASLSQKLSRILSHLNFSILLLLPNFGHFVLFKFALKIFTGKVLSRNTKVEIANRAIRSNCVIPRNAVGDGTYTAAKHDEGFLYLFEVSSHPTLGKHQKLCN